MEASSLGNLCRFSVTVRVKKCFLMVSRKLLCFSLCHCLWYCHWAPLQRAWLLLLCTCLHVLVCVDEISPWAVSSVGWTVPAPSAFPLSTGKTTSIKTQKFCKSRKKLPQACTLNKRPESDHKYIHKQGHRETTLSFM